MQKKQIAVLVAAGMIAILTTAVSRAVDSGLASAFSGQDLRMGGHKLVSYQISTGEHIFVFDDGFSMSIGGNTFTSGKAVVRLNSITSEHRGKVSVEYRAEAYMQGDVSLKKSENALTADLSRTVTEDGKSEIVRFNVSGEVFVTAEQRQTADPRGTELYEKALAVSMTVPEGPLFVVQPGAEVPPLPGEEPAKTAKKVKEKKPGLFAKAGKKAAPVKKAEKEVKFSYPINFASIDDKPLRMESVRGPDGTNVATIMQKFYVWQKQDESGMLLELKGDSAVVFYAGGTPSGKEAAGTEDVLSKSGIKAVYLGGNVVMTEGLRTIRADEIYYDFEEKKGAGGQCGDKKFRPEARRSYICSGGENPAGGGKPVQGGTNNNYDK